MSTFPHNYLRKWKLFLSDDLVSYFAYFTTILTEIAFLWAFNIPNTPFFTILLFLCMVNVFASAFWKAIDKGSKAEIFQCFTFVGTIFVLFAFGCKVSFVASLCLFTIPLAITLLWIIIREFQNTRFRKYRKKSIRMRLSRLFHNKFIYILSYLITILGPICLLSVFISMTTLPTYLKVLLPLIYVLLLPYIGFAEYSIAACNIYELMFPCGYLMEQEYQRMHKHYMSHKKNGNYDDYE